MSQQETFSELIKKRVRIDDVFFVQTELEREETDNIYKTTGKTDEKKATSGLKRRNKSCL
jgi:hypothetical protein